MLDESQIYRIDHYLGKETVQNILSFRFGNSIFEPLFNHRYVDSVQITVAETLGMEGSRGAYYDTAGIAARHGAEPHAAAPLPDRHGAAVGARSAGDARREGEGAARAAADDAARRSPPHTVRGQYGVGERDGKIVHGYRQEKGVAPDSTTETYVALRTTIDNWRWAGVPFFLRSGKRLAATLSEIAVQLQAAAAALLFRDFAEREDGETPRAALELAGAAHPARRGHQPVVRLQAPGHAARSSKKSTWTSSTARRFSERSPEAYERLLLDALRGDASLFTRSDEVEYAWRFITVDPRRLGGSCRRRRFRTTTRSPTVPTRRSGCSPGPRHSGGRSRSRDDEGAETMNQAIGVIGLAVMGENLALNIERNGFPIAVYNRTPEKTDAVPARPRARQAGRRRAQHPGVRRTRWRGRAAC